RPEGRGDHLPDLLVHRPRRNPARGFIRLHAVPPPAEAVSLTGRPAMSGSFSPRPIGLAAVILLFGIGFVAVLSHPSRERVSFDAVIAVWSSILRDIDRIGLTLSQIGSEQEVQIGQAIDREVSREFGYEDTSVRTAYVRNIGRTLTAFAQRQDIPY